MSRSLRWTGLAVSAGVVAGLLEGLPLRLAGAVGVPVHVTPHFTWILPLLDGVLFGVVAGAILLTARLRRREPTAASFVAATVGGAALLLLLIVEALHPVASLLLAAGMGVQAGRMAGPRTLRVARRGLPALALAALAVGVAQGVLLERGRSAAERAAQAALVVPRSGAPDVVLLILDTVRAWELGSWGGPEGLTPNLDAIAERGVLFETAVSPSPWTLPSHASLFTGEWPDDLGVVWGSRLPDDVPTLAESMAGGGYATAGFTANLLNTSRFSGLHRGFQRWEDFTPSLGSAFFASSLVRVLSLSERVRSAVARHELLSRKPAPEINRDFFEWLDGRVGRSGRPFFAYLNYFDAHEPYAPPGTLRSPREWNDYVHRGGVMLGENAWVSGKWELPPAEVEVHLQSYRDAIARADRALGELLDGLEARGRARNTLIVIVSDHGEQMGENGLFEHNNSLYPAALHVPLILHHPTRLPSGTRVETPISTRDLPSTILRIAGAPDGLLPGLPLTTLWTEEGAAGSTPGRSADSAGESGGGGAADPGEREIRAHLTLGAVDQPDTPIDAGTMRAVWVGHWQYIRNGDGSEELYDWKTDPTAVVDRIGDPAAAGVLKRARALLDR